MFRPSGVPNFIHLCDEVDELQIEMRPTRRARYARRGATPNVQAITTSLDTEIPIRVMGVSQIFEAMSLMADASILDAALGAFGAPEQAEDVQYAPATSAMAPASRRAMHEARQPWYRQHERQRIGRATR